MKIVIKKILATVLNIIALGSGHLMMGKTKKALILGGFTLLIFLSMKTISNYAVYLGVMILVIIVFFYALIDVWFISATKDKYSRWYFVLLFIALIFGVTELFKLNPDSLNFKNSVIVSDSMNKTLLKGDMIFVQKDNEVSRNDVVVFHYPKQPKIYFIERVFAVAGDEVLFVDSKLLLHFYEGDSYIEKHYSKESIKKYQGKLWVENPYMLNNKNIHYTVNESIGSLFQMLMSTYRDIGMSPILLENNGKKMNAFYVKVEQNQYFMIGDNRENSNDSRFFGSVDKHYIYGVGKHVYMNFSDIGRIGKEIY